MIWKILDVVIPVMLCIGLFILLAGLLHSCQQDVNNRLALEQQRHNEIVDAINSLKGGSQ